VYRTAREHAGALRLDVSWMCDQAGVSRSGYYSYAARKGSPAASARESRDYADFLLVKEAFDYKGRPKGSRTISMMMPRLFGVAMNRKKVRRLMGKYGLECPARRANPLKRIARAIQSNTTFSNKLNRQFAVGRPGEHLLTDISYIHYGPHLERLCFLSALKDASTNEIVAWTLSESLGLEFVIEMLRKLDSVGWLPPTVLIHSDQGCHYTSYAYIRFLSDAGIAQSMSRRGNCWDNAPMESFFGHAKDELSLRRCSDFQDVLEEMASYIDYYNNDRPQMGLGKMTPAEFRDYLLARPVRLPAIINEKDGCRPAAIL
jgi:putative transposase